MLHEPVVCVFSRTIGQMMVSGSNAWSFSTLPSPRVPSVPVLPDIFRQDVAG